MILYYLLFNIRGQCETEKKNNADFYQFESCYCRTLHHRGMWVLVGFEIYE